MARVLTNATGCTGAYAQPMCPGCRAQHNDIEVLGHDAGLRSDTIAQTRKEGMVAGGSI